MKNNTIMYIIAALIVGVVIGLYLPNKTDNSVSTTSINKVEIQKVINEKLIQGGLKATVEKINPVGNISEVKIKVKDQEDSLYVSDNSKVFYQKIVDFDEVEKQKKEAAAAKVVKNKTDKPEVELFIMSYCPYGTQAEKGYLPAINKLGDKIDAKVKFVNYVMHSTQGEGEENLLQYCIQKTAPKKFNSYLACFLEEGKTDECLSKNNILKDSLKICLTETDAKFKISENKKDKSKWLNGRFPKFNVQDDLNKKYGVQGSPTLVINGQKIEGVGRDANSFFKAICSAFKVQPEICKEELSTETYKAGFGYDAQAAGAATEAGCGA